MSNYNILIYTASEKDCIPENLSKNIVKMHYKNVTNLSDHIVKSSNNVLMDITTQFHRDSVNKNAVNFSQCIQRICGDFTNGIKYLVLYKESSKDKDLPIYVEAALPLRSLYVKNNEKVVITIPFIFCQSE